MNYEYWTDETTPSLLAEFNQFPELRPHVGDRLELDNQEWFISRCNPTNNSAIQKVLYYLTPYKEPLTEQEQIDIGF